MLSYNSCTRSCHDSGIIENLIHMLLYISCTGSCGGGIDVVENLTEITSYTDYVSNNGAI